MAVEEGSIVARLRVDSSDFKAKLAEAQAQAEELGRTDPHIRVDVDSAKAIAQLEAVSLASDRASKSFTRMGSSQSFSVNRTGLIIAAIVALIPLLAALSGYAVGVAGALAGMGAAGVLAVIGIKNAMADGTAQGALYRDGLGTLKGVLDSLAGTAATAMLSSFQHAVKQINDALPDLNNQIDGFSRQLGIVGNTLLTGVIQAFKVLNPLFVQAGQYVEQLAAGFTKWTEDGGLKRFADYAQDALPRVAQTLGSLASAILHIVEATAPIGDVVLGILTALGDAINGIPTPVLTVLIGAAAGVYLGFKAWNSISGIIGRVTASLTEFAATRGGINGVSDSIRAFTASAAGLASIAIGIPLLVTALADLAGTGLGNLTMDMTGLSKQVNILQEATARGDFGSAKAQKSFHILDGTLKSARSQLGGFVGFLLDTSNQMDKSGFGWLAGPAQAVLQATLGKTSKTVDAYTAAAKAAKSAQDSAATSASSLAAQVGALKTAFDGLNNTNLSVAQAQTAQAAAFNSVTTSIQQNGAAIDGNSAAAVANQQAIQQAALAAQANATAVATQTGSTNAGTQAFMSSKTALEQQLAAQGLLTPAIQAYVDTLFKVPTSVATKLSADTAAANAAIAATKSQLDALTASPYKVYIEGVKIGDFGHINVPGNPGGPDKVYAAGGTVTGPGSSTSDSIVARLSNSEEVTANDQGQASKYRAALKAINANAPVSTVQSILAGMRSSSAGTVSASPAPVVNVHAPSAAPASNVYKFYITEASDADATAQRVLHYIQNTSA